MMNNKNIDIFGNDKIYIIAELSCNHQQDYDTAVETIEAISNSGADAVKLQTYTPDTMTIDCNNKNFQIEEGPWSGRTLYDLYQEAYTPWDWQPKLKDYAEELGLQLFSSAFDKTAVDFLEEMDVPAYKVASFEIQDIPLIKYIASKGKPVIMSTGIATLSDIEAAVKACREVGNDQIALLKCTSSYPAPIEKANLKTIPNMRETFDVIVGLSDHTLGSTVPITSVALGAQIIEKHFILDRDLDSPDAEFSMEPEEFKQMVKSVRKAEQAVGDVNYELSDKVEENKQFARSLFVVKDIEKGEKFTEENVKSIRPGYGLDPKYYDKILGNRATRNLDKGTPIDFKEIK